MKIKDVIKAVLFLIACSVAGWGIVTTVDMARAQVTTPGLPLVPLGYCQIATLSSSVAITGTSCVGASFTATGSGTNLTTSSVTGLINIGAQIAGTGTTTGTYIVSQTSGTAGGAGVYVTSAVTTSSAASLTSGGIIRGATSAFLQAEAQIVRYRDDTGAPTATVGMPIASAGSLLYGGTISALRFIEATSSAKLNVLQYR